MRHLSALITLFALAFAVGAGWDHLPEAPDAARAEVEQTTIPSLQARAEAAERRIAARQAYFAGEGTLGAAFPELSGAALDRPAVLSGKLVMLDDRAVERAAALVAPLPDLGDEEQVAALRDAHEVALDAEDRADALQRRLLLALRAHLTAHPALTAASLAPERARLQSVVDQASAAAAAAPEDERAEAVRRAALADADRQALEDLTAALRRTAVVPGAAVPRPDDAPFATPATRFRLSVLEPFLSPESRAEAQEAERRWLVEVRIPAIGARTPGPLPLEASDLAAAVTALDGEIAVLQERFDALPAGEPDSLAAARRTAAELELSAAQASRDRAAARVEELAKAASAATTEAERSRTQAATALAEAKQAREQARGQTEIQVAELGTAAAEAQQRAAEAWEATRDLEASLAEGQRIRRDDLVGYSAKAQGAEVTLGFGQDQVDALYRELRAYVAGLRTEASDVGARILQRQDARRLAGGAAVAARADIRAARETAAELTDKAQRASWEEALGRWAAALEDEGRAHDAAVRVTREEQDDILHVLHAAAELKRQLWSRVSRAEREADRGELLVDLGHELELIGPMVVSGARDRTRSLVGLPASLRDFNFLTQLVSGSFYTLLLVLAWWYLHRGVPTLSGLVLTRLRAWDPRLRPRDLHTLRTPLEGFARPLVDVVLAMLLLNPVSALSPELGFLLRVFVYVTAYRLAVAAFDLAMVQHPSDRPGLFTLGARTHALARWTVRWITLWWLTRRFVRYLLLHLLDADVVDSVSRFAFDVVGVALIARLLHAWAPQLRARISRLHQGSAVIRTLSREPPHWSLNALHAIAILTTFAVTGLAALLYRLASKQEGVGRLFNVVTRYRMMRDDEQPVAQLDDELRRGLVADECPNDAYLRRDEVDGALVAALDAWRKERRQGLVAFVGDRGSGKRTILDRFVSSLAAGTSDLGTVRVRLGRRLTQSEEVLHWLAEALDMPPTADQDALVDAINAREPTLHVFEEVHHAFLRTVNGFDALRTLLYVLNACGERHFWVLSFHRPAWQYLSRIGSLVNTQVFRRVIQAAPMTADELLLLTRNRVLYMGKTLDFTGLVGNNPFGADPEVELERATGSYFRLLAEASQGNPGVALHVFAASLVPNGDDTLRVRITRDLDLGVVTELTEADLFTLVALRTQDLLDETEMVAVTNMGPAVVRSTVKHLQQRGLVEYEGPRVTIPQPQLPAVTRTLRRRHFIQG